MDFGGGGQPPDAAVTLPNLDHVVMIGVGTTSPCQGLRWRSSRMALPPSERRGRPATLGRVKLVDRDRKPKNQDAYRHVDQGYNSAWAGLVEVEPPLTRICIECRCEFGRRMSNGKLRSPQRWRRSLYCSRACCAQHRLRRKASPKLTGYLAGLDPPPSPPKPRRSCSAALGRPSRKTELRAILAADRIKRIMEARFDGASFREIGLAEGVSMQRIHKLFWKTMRSTPHDPARLRRLAARERATLGNDHASG